MPATKEDKEEYLEERRNQSYIAEKYINEKSVDAGLRATHHEEIVHPNEE